MPSADRALAWADRRQRSFPPAAFAVAVVKKYGDDRGGSLSAIVTFYGFLAVFPLLLLFVTLVGIIVGPSSETERAIVHSALSQFPVIGTHLDQNIHALSRGSPLAFAVSVIGLLWGAFGITNALERASADIWAVPRNRQPKLAGRLTRGAMILGVLAAAVLLSSVLATVSTLGRSHFGSELILARTLTFVGAVLLNVGGYYAALRILAPSGTRSRQLLAGTMFGGVTWTAVQALGGYLISHQLQRTTELYGFFAIVLGLVLWLNIGAHLFLLATEVNVVRTRRLWPRSLANAEHNPPSP
jgi:YihY family inner membrane protein